MLSQDGSAPLHRAVSMLHVDAVRLLLERSDPNKATADGTTPLELCADMLGTPRRGPGPACGPHLVPPLSFAPSALPSLLPLPDEGRVLKIASMLLAAGANPGQLLSAAAQCPDPAFGLLLLAHGAAHGGALWHAVQRCPELVQPLLDAGADPLQGCGGRLPVDVAPPDAAWVAVLRRETRWRQVRMFAWAHARGVPVETGLAALPQPVGSAVLEFLA